jgi:hypothetical protein
MPRAGMAVGMAAPSERDEVEAESAGRAPALGVLTGGGGEVVRPAPPAELALCAASENKPL